MTTRGLRLAVLERSVLVFLADVSFHARVALVDICGDWRLHVFGVEDLVHDVVAVGFHVLLWFSQSVVFYSGIRNFTHVNLVRRPTVHSQGLDLGDMGAQLAVQRSTSHAQKDSHLLPNHQYLVFSR